MHGKKISIIDIAIVILEKKRFLFFSMLTISVAAVIIALLLPKYYTANAVLLPSSGNTLKNPFSAILGDLPINSMMESLDFLGSSDNDQLLAILGSRTIAERVIDRFDLAKRYEFDKKKEYFIEDVMRRFYQNYDVTENDFNNIQLAFTDTSPTFSAEVVNFIITQLDSINSEISRKNARNTRSFFEERIAIVKNDMDSAHSRFATFQEEHNYIDLEQQIISSIEALSKVEAQILTNDINTEFVKNRYGADNYEYKELRKNRKVLESRMKHYLDSGSGELIIPLKNAPRLGIEYSYLYRDVKVQEMLHAFLLQNFEQAKLSEANNTPTVNILEYARVPQKKSRPKRGILCILIFFAGLIGNIIIILIMKWFAIQAAENTEAFEKVTALRAQLKKW